MSDPIVWAIYIVAGFVVALTVAQSVEFKRVGLAQRAGMLALAFALWWLWLIIKTVALATNPERKP